MIYKEDEIENEGSIAIIGMSCRFPGARNIDEFWDNLKQGIESITYFTDEDFKENGFIHKKEVNDANFVKAGFILDDIEAFDASFFEYSPKEARLMDPQHRIFLECAWKALEDSGYPPGSPTTSTGVFAGARMSTYQFNIKGNWREGGITSAFQKLVANDKDYLTSRVSYKLDLKGPSVTVQSACSTSLVAVHFACENLLNGNCDMALAGGAAIMVPQKMGYLYQEGMVFSPDGHCRPFDIRANGMVGGNGVGIVVLKRLNDAIASGDQIIAVIKGSAVNNDGSMKIGYTAPSVEGQSEVIREAMAIAGVEADSISYIEAHGTGTALGDPIEIAALTRAFRTETEKKGFCAIGSVKSNIGHLDTAAGVASLIKTALSIKNKKIPPSLNFEKPNPRIDFENSPFFVNAHLSQWKNNQYPRRAGVSSFGFGGTNAHVILEQAPQKHADTRNSENKPAILAISAKKEETLTLLLKRYRDFIENTTSKTIANICYTANVGRTHFPYRTAFIADSLDDLRSRIDDAINRQQNGNLHDESIGEDPSSRIGFIFTGRGNQIHDVVRKLYESVQVFKNNLDRCDETLRKQHNCFIIQEILDENKSAIDNTPYSQAAIFSFQYAFSSMLIAWGIKPGAVIGHGIGEIAAACIAGVFTLENGLNQVVSRDAHSEQISGSDQTVAMVECTKPGLNLFSCETGQMISEQDVCNPAYWEVHCRS